MPSQHTRRVESTRVLYAGCADAEAVCAAYILSPAFVFSCLERASKDAARMAYYGRCKISLCTCRDTSATPTNAAWARCAGVALSPSNFESLRNSIKAAAAIMPNTRTGAIDSKPRSSLVKETNLQEMRPRLGQQRVLPTRGQTKYLSTVATTGHVED